MGLVPEASPCDKSLRQVPATSPCDKSLRQVPATSPLVCADLYFVVHLLAKKKNCEMADIFIHFISIWIKQITVNGSGGGGGTPLYGLYRYVRPQRVWFFSHFGHK